MAKARQSIRIRGAREHNLKNVSLSLPRDRLIVVTGLSGSGKSSLAFDTIYAEGQRRYVESLSSYARQFLEQLKKPAVEGIEGLPPTIAIEQRSGGASPRSTVATTTEIYDYLRLLYARVGRPHCPRCQRPISRQTPDQIVGQLLAGRPGSRLLLLAPVVRGRKGEHRELLAGLQQSGFTRVRLDGRVLRLEEARIGDPKRQHEIEVVVDRLAVDPGQRSRFVDSVELALRTGGGVMIAASEAGDGWRDHYYSVHYACPNCAVSLEEPAPRQFSFNSPYGACPTCDGLGTRMEFDPDFLIPNPDLSLAEGALKVFSRSPQGLRIRLWHLLRAFSRQFRVDPETPVKRWTAAQRRQFLQGPDRPGRSDWPGLVPYLQQRFAKTGSDYLKKRLHEFMSELPCPDCDGARLRPESLGYRVAGLNIREVTKLTIAAAGEWFAALAPQLAEKELTISRLIRREIGARLSFLADVGLGYLTLDRTSSTLAGGEAQRIRLATQVGSGLVGVCYVLDEPTIGLHPRDSARLLATLKRLRDLGNTVIIVEHDEWTIRRADHIVDLGPGAGAQGGRVVAQGSPAKIARARRSLTGAFLAGREKIPVPERRRAPDPRRQLQVVGAAEHNLKQLDVSFPLGLLIGVTGVSGSGKSTLVTEILYRALARALNRSREKPGRHRSLKGLGLVERVRSVNQSPIGRTPRSNPATYTDVFGPIRRLFALTPAARARGYLPARFSFNLKGGRCEACQGHGQREIEMHFLPDLQVVCDECRGRRFNRETLAITYRGRNIADVLDMSVRQARDFFAAHPPITRILDTLVDVGLCYIALGQSATTLSGGEAQRIKLAAELGQRQGGGTVYLMDEPTTGLHFADIAALLKVLDRLVAAGNTVIVIEHNMEVIKTVDYLIDLGPEGGAAGGQLVAAGTPEEIARHPHSHTGRFLRPLLKRGGQQR